MIHHVQEGHVKTETHKGITTIEFFHPQSNSLPAKILEELTHAIHIAGNNDECKVIILQSDGDKIFCSGASFDELLAITTEAEGLKFFSGFANVINAMRKCPKCIIGRIQGKSGGGGVGIVEFGGTFELRFCFGQFAPTLEGLTEFGMALRRLRIFFYSFLKEFYCFVRFTDGQLLAAIFKDIIPIGIAFGLSVWPSENSTECKESK